MNVVFAEPFSTCQGKATKRWSANGSGDGKWVITNPPAGDRKEFIILAVFGVTAEFLEEPGVIAVSPVVEIGATPVSSRAERDSS